MADQPETDAERLTRIKESTYATGVAYTRDGRRNVPHTMLPTEHYRWLIAKAEQRQQAWAEVLSIAYELNSWAVDPKLPSPESFKVNRDRLEQIAKDNWEGKPLPSPPEEA